MPDAASRDAPPVDATASATGQVTLWDWGEDGISLVVSPELEPHAGPDTAVPASPPAGPPGATEPLVFDTARLPVIGRRRRSRGEKGDATAPVVDAPIVFRPRRIPGSDVTIFPLVLSGAPFGWTVSGEQSLSILDAFADVGGNAIDTADSYSTGRSETIIGTWLRSRGDRDRFVVSSKVGRRGDRAGLGAHSMIRATEESLSRLQIETLDILYFHLDDPVVPLEESLTAADSLVRSGKVRHIAATGYSADRLMEARVVAGQLALPRFLGVQVDYNLLARSGFEAELSPVARAQELAVFASSSLARGFLGGAYRGRRTPKAAVAPSRSMEMSQHMNKRGFRVLDALDQVAAEHGVAPATAALAWLLTKPLVTAPVAGATSPEQVGQLARAASVHLTRAQVATLDRASA